ncbi:DUF456 domain-containing protein [Reichenbachiella sp. MALMAid0571]|uniref:DUF456 domain-containing protein n=1 Tax=Reichenbachiella sp. MALMAid0571 TaxID=3143939 RepID=UPI0032DEC80E
MDYFWTILGIVLLIAGIIGCLLPILPGPPLGFLSLLVLQFKTNPPFSTSFILIWLAITIAVFTLDYTIPPMATKKFGGSRKGVTGSIVGLVVGLIFFPPFGLIVGSFLGAFIGEIIDGQQRGVALKSAFGSLIGFVTGSVLKLTTVFIMGYYFTASLF